MFVKVTLLLLLAISFTQEGTRACNNIVQPGYVTKKEGETATLYCKASMTTSRVRMYECNCTSVTVTTSVSRNTSAIASTSTCVIASTSTKPVSVIANRGSSGNATVSVGVSASVSTKSVCASVSASSSTSVSASSSASVSASSSASVSTTSVNASCSCIQPTPTTNCTWKVSWTKDGSTLSSHSRISFGACSESLTINDIKRTDTGVYRCEAHNNLGSVIFDRNVTLDVLFAPEITTHPQDVTQIEGNLVNFSCNATGNPVPTTWWTKDASQLAGDARISGVNNDTLTIKNVRRTDGGNYRCEASNCVGTTTSEAAMLNVLYPPEITSHPQNETIIEGNSVTFSCAAIGNPSPSISWTKDGALSINIGDPRFTFTELNRKLTITNVNRTDGGEYRCVAINSLGNATSNPATLNVQSGPDQLLTVKVDFKGSRVVNISWTAVFHGSNEILNYTVEISEDNQTFRNAKCEGLSVDVCVVSGNSTSASLQGLHPGRTYYIRLFATSKAGFKVTSSVVNATTDEEEPHAPPVNLHGHSTSSTSILVQWGEVPAADQNGIIRSYTVTYNTLPSGSPKTEVVNAPTRQATLTGLNEYTNYSITVFASTAKGGGNVSNPIIVITDEDKPSAPPANVHGHNTSSTSILVQWGEVPAADQNGIIWSYTVSYKALPSGSQNTEVVNATTNQTTLTGLKEYTNYSITVFASTVKGDGNVSSPIIVITDEDKPDASPLNLRPVDTTLTSILVTWDEVPAADQNGIILTYTVRYQMLGEGGVNASINSTTVVFPTQQANLTGLQNDTRFNISVLASTIKGDGPYSQPIIVSTNQDKPGAPPENVQGHNSSSTSIFVEWDEVPAENQNGEILNYTVMYGKAEGGEAEKKKQVNSPIRNVQLTNLTKYTSYSIKVLAATVKGDGPPSDPIQVRTDEDKPSSSPTITNVTVLSSTSVLVIWKPVPAESRHGIIVQYTVHYEGVNKENQKDGIMIVKAPVLQAIVNGLRQKAEYTFWIVAATSKGNGPVSNAVKATTGAVPTVKPPHEEDIGTTAVTVPFRNTTHLSNGSPVSYYQMIVTPLKTEQDPGNTADTKYESVTRTYEDQVQGEPYITAEFAKKDATTTFTVGDGKYYSRNGITDTRRRRRDVSSFTVYLNGKLNDNTKYAVFQRSFDKDGDYENEGFIQFTTKEEVKQTQSKEKSPTVIIVTVVVVFLVLVLVACATVIWYRRSRRNAGRIVPDHEETKASSKNLHDDPKEEIIVDIPGKHHSSEDPTQEMTA